MKAPVRVAVTGAAGQIGYALLFRIASGEMLGKDQPVILQLLELPVDKAQAALKGVMMELEDCAFPLLAGMVGNPANTNAYIAMKSAPDLNPRNFTAMLRLDHNRALSQLSTKLGKPVAGMEKLVVWGNHSPTMYPDYRFATADGASIADAINDQEWNANTFIPTVGKRGAAIIEARGSSSAASAANAAIDHVRDWVLGSNGKWVTMGVPSDGSYGIPEGVIFGFAVTTENGEYTLVKDLPVDDFSQKYIDKTLAELEEERAGVAHLLG